MLTTSRVVPSPPTSSAFSTALNPERPLEVRLRHLRVACDHHARASRYERRATTRGVFTLISSLLAMDGSWNVAGNRAATAAGLKCPGLSGNNLRDCLREYRKSEQGKDADDAVEEYRQKVEQPGELVTLPSGIQYREINPGNGRPCNNGDVCAISFQVFRLSSGAYFKYSSGGRPITIRKKFHLPAPLTAMLHHFKSLPPSNYQYMWQILLFAQGYGTEGQDDVGSVYKFVLGDKNSLPRAATVAIKGMKEGGKRRILIPPQVGWVNEKVGPQPATFGGRRRLENHKDEPLLFEVDMVLVKQFDDSGEGSTDDVQLARPFELPAPPNPFRRKIGE